MADSDETKTEDVRKTKAEWEAEQAAATKAAETEAKAGGSQQEVRDAVSSAAPTLTDAQCEKIADGVFGKFEAAGAFEKPEPAKDGTDESDEDAAHGDDEKEKIPPKRSFAHRFAGVD
jgi:hypothetical protein